ncbi:MAG: hypothetical protein LBJ89_00745 [Holosporales bacterium]|jgi:hypothetical protein|nr:hypothetical protein [Holosporales bacterium]
MLKNWRLLCLSGPLFLVGCDGLKKESKTEAAPGIDKTALDKPAAEPASNNKASTRTKAQVPNSDSQPSEKAHETEKPAAVDVKSPPEAAPVAEPAKKAEITTEKINDTPEVKSDTATKAAPVAETGEKSEPAAAEVKSKATTEASEAKSEPAVESTPTADKGDAKKKSKKSEKAAKPEESTDETEASIRNKIVDLIKLDAAKLPEWVKTNVAFLNIMKTVTRGVIDIKDKANQHYVDTFPEFLASVFESFIPILKGYKIISVKLDKSNKNSKVFAVDLESNEPGTDGNITKVKATVITTKSLRVGNVVVLDAGVVPLVKVAFDGVCENGKIVQEKWDKEIARFKK